MSGLSTAAYIRRAAREELLSWQHDDTHGLKRNDEHFQTPTVARVKFHHHRGSHAYGLDVTPDAPHPAECIMGTPVRRRNTVNDACQADVDGEQRRTPPSRASACHALLQTVRWSETAAKLGLKSPALSPVRTAHNRCAKEGGGRYLRVAGLQSHETPATPAAILSTAKQSSVYKPPRLGVMASSIKSVKKASLATVFDAVHLLDSALGLQPSRPLISPVIAGISAEMHEGASKARFQRRGRTYKTELNRPAEDHVVERVAVEGPGPLSAEDHMAHKTFLAVESADITKLSAAISSTLVSANAINSAGETLVMVAAKHGCDLGVNFLYSHGAGLDTPDMMGNTALHYAAREGKKSTIRLLISLGADDNVKNVKGQTYYDLLW